MTGIPLEQACDHSPGVDPRRRGARIKCGRKLCPVPAVTVGEGIELLRLLDANPRYWNRRLREKLTATLGSQNLST